MRLTSAQIDQGILDTAAGIFATYGFANTSLQQVADAVGYSKAGLLHRFGSKDALHSAVVASAVSLVETVIAEASAMPPSHDRLRRILTLMSREALRSTGAVRMMLHAFDPTNDEPGAEDLQAVGYRLVDLIDRPLSTPRERLRVVLALQLLVNAAMAQSSTVDADMHVPPAELVPLVVDLSLGVLGSA